MTSAERIQRMSKVAGECKNHVARARRILNVAARECGVWMPDMDADLDDAASEAAKCVTVTMDAGGWPDTDDHAIVVDLTVAIARELAEYGEADDVRQIAANHATTVTAKNPRLLVLDKRGEPVEGGYVVVEYDIAVE